MANSDEALTIPAVLARTVQRPAPVRRSSTNARGSRSPSSPTQATRRGSCARRRRHRARRPGRDLGAEHAPSGWSPRSASTRPGGVVVPLTRASRARRRAYILDRADAQAALHRHRLPRHRLRRAARARPTPVAGARGDRRAARDADRGHRRAGPSSSRAPAMSPRRIAARRAALTGDDLSRHPLHVGHHRPPEGRDAHARRKRARPTTRGRTWSACAPATAT